MGRHRNRRLWLPWGPLLEMVARDAATNDLRLPCAVLQELPYLSIEVSLMHNPQPVTARGEDRIRSVHVGTHGLVISHPNGRGLLLPHVANEAKWDSKTFLEHTCQKAGLPSHVWRDDQTSLMTFYARKLSSHKADPRTEPRPTGVGGSLPALHAHSALARSGRRGRNPQSNPGPLLLHQVHAEDLGLVLQTASGVTGASIGPNNTLFNLGKTAAQSLANIFKQRAQSEPIQMMSLLWQPLQLVAADYPARHRALANSAVLAQADGRWSLLVPPPNVQADKIAEALAALKLTHQTWLQDHSARIRLTAFNVLHCHNQLPANSPAPQMLPAAASQVRPAFRAGAFYPADPAQTLAEVDGYLRAGGMGQSSTQIYRAIMLPHAGWKFCGSTMGKTLAAVKLPKTVIIIGPKHTPLGPAWSVANHTAWQIPGATIPVAQPIIQPPASKPSRHSHANPKPIGRNTPSKSSSLFLLRLRPDLHIVPIVLGPSPMTLSPLLLRHSHPSSVTPKPAAKNLPSSSSPAT